MSNQIIHIDSSDRSSGNHNDFKVIIHDNQLGNNKDVSIHSLIIPFSYYAINDNNNDFLAGPTGGDTITLTNGNYTSNELATELKTQLDAVLTPTYTVSHDSKTGKFTFSSGDSSDFVIITDTKNYKYLGFNASSTNNSASGSLVSTNVIDVAGTRYIDIRSNLHTHSSNSSNNNRDLLARIYPNSDPFASIFYDHSSFEGVYFDGNYLRQLELALYDDNNDLLDLNGQEWSISLITKLRNQFLPDNLNKSDTLKFLDMRKN